jgi:hypothetical protein
MPSSHSHHHALPGLNKRKKAARKYRAAGWLLIAVD